MSFTVITETTVNNCRRCPYASYYRDEYNRCPDSLYCTTLKKGIWTEGDNFNIFTAIFSECPHNK